MAESGIGDMDRALIRRVLSSDDRRAFDQLVRRHQGMVRAQLRRLTHGDDATADDLAQEAFLQAWKKLDQFRGDALFSTWLYRIAYSCFLQARRRTSWSDVRSDDEATASLSAPPQRLDLQLDLSRAMQRLSDGEQAVLLHCFQLGLSHEETAYVLGMPLGTVKSHALRGKQKLKQWLTPWQDTDHHGDTA